MRSLPLVSAPDHTCISDGLTPSTTHHIPVGYGGEDRRKVFLDRIDGSHPGTVKLSNVVDSA